MSILKWLCILTGPELDGTDLSEYSDPEGKKLFVEFVKVVKAAGNGFVDYRWQWKDDSTKNSSQIIIRERI